MIEEDKISRLLCTALVSQLDENMPYQEDGRGQTFICFALQMNENMAHQ